MVSMWLHPHPHGPCHVVTCVAGEPSPSSVDEEEEAVPCLSGHWGPRSPSQPVLFPPHPALPPSRCHALLPRPSQSRPHLLGGLCPRQPGPVGFLRACSVDGKCNRWGWEGWCQKRTVAVSWRFRAQGGQCSTSASSLVCTVSGTRQGRAGIGQRQGCFTCRWAYVPASSVFSLLPDSSCDCGDVSSPRPPWLPSRHSRQPARPGHHAQGQAIIQRFTWSQGAGEPRLHP